MQQPSTANHPEDRPDGPPTAGGPLPLVSVVAPMYNEERFIRQFIECLLAQTYPADRLEILLVDGGSTDRTLQIAREMAREHPCLHILHNPDRFSPQGQNVGVRNARGEIVARVDIHAGYPPEYIAACVEALRTRNVWVVGGILRTEPGGTGHVARAIAIVQSHVFGVGNSGDRISDKERIGADPVFPCLWRWVFQKVGLYNELMPRHEDLELFSRVRRAGGQMMIVPSIRSTYYSRPAVWPLLSQAWYNGYETAMAWLADPACVRLRHWVPGVFVATLLVLGVASFFSEWARWLLQAVAGAYGMALLIASAHVGFTRGWRCVPAVLPMFVLHHLSYGMGTVLGVFGLAKVYRKVRNYRFPVLDEGRCKKAPVAVIVSILVPMRNEEAWIRKTLDALLPDIGPRDDAEILCVDGMSDDGTRDIIAEYAARDPRIRLIDNPGKTLPRALNVGIRHARGRIILRMDAHAECSPGYVWKNVELLERTGAECVGGYLTTRAGRDTPVGRAIAAALRSPFGVGGCRSRTAGGKEEESDEATFGCFSRDLFNRIGMFDERLTRNQDMEFFCRIRSRGGRIIISPEIQATYFSRPT